MPLRGMGEFPLRPCYFFGIFTPCRYDDGTALMPVVTRQEQLPKPVIATRQEELSLPVLVIHRNQVSLPAEITVFPEGGNEICLTVFVTVDMEEPPLSGEISIMGPSGGRPKYPVNVVITPQDQPLLPGTYQNQGAAIFYRYSRGRPQPTAFIRHSPLPPSQWLHAYATDRDRLSLPVHARYIFLAPDAEDPLPSDWYCSSFRLMVGASDPSCRYMRICGLAADALHGDALISREFPSEELGRYCVPRVRSSK